MVLFPNLPCGWKPIYRCEDCGENSEKPGIAYQCHKCRTAGLSLAESEARLCGQGRDQIITIICDKCEVVRSVRLQQARLREALETRHRQNIQAADTLLDLMRDDAAGSQQQVTGAEAPDSDRNETEEDRRMDAARGLVILSRGQTFSQPTDQSVKTESLENHNPSSRS